MNGAVLTSKKRFLMENERKMTYENSVNETFNIKYKY